MPLFSIITVNLNNASGLKKTIESVVSQTFNDFEYIVVDGASSDESVDIIKNFESKISYWVSEKDSGVYNAMNKGIKRAAGKYFLFLNSGDMLVAKDVLKKVADSMSHEAIVYGDLFFSMKYSKRLGKQPDELSIIHMIRGTIFHPASFIEASLLKNVDGFDESFKIAGDYDFFVKVIILDKVKTHHLPFPIAVFNTSGLSNIRANKTIEVSERTLIQQKYFTDLQLKDAAAYSKLINSFFYRVVNFIERKTGIKSLTDFFFKINYY
jgi:glycosyltransferase involved in cell wall biosynthesis